MGKNRREVTSVDGHLGYFQFLAVVNNATGNMGVLI